MWPFLFFSSPFPPLFPGFFSPSEAKKDLKTEVAEIIQEYFNAEEQRHAMAGLVLLSFSFFFLFLLSSLPSPTRDIRLAIEWRVWFFLRPIFRRDMRFPFSSLFSPPPPSSFSRFARAFLLLVCQSFWLDTVEGPSLQKGIRKEKTMMNPGRIAVDFSFPPFPFPFPPPQRPPLPPPSSLAHRSSWAEYAVDGGDNRRALDVTLPLSFFPPPPRKLLPPPSWAWKPERRYKSGSRVQDLLLSFSSPGGCPPPPPPLLLKSGMPRWSGK